ncbi:MAG: 39S ribosomal protein L45 [Alphaproteobacteria bacterium]|nr:39S ribosomal protein L45 [Alphaproteobacteria bacterium]
MHVDILIFAVIAAILIYRLNAVLGTRNGDEPSRKNPFDEPSRPLDAPPRTGAFTGATPMPKPAPQPAAPVDPAADAAGLVSEGLKEIASADRAFDAARFIGGAEYAFNLIVDAYARGDRAALKPLLSPKLYAGFDSGIAARETAGAPAAGAVSRSIKSAQITEAHLGGTMAYVTVEFHVAQTSPNAAAPEDVTDIWTFTRDTRSSDPNWILIETRTAEK